MGLFHRKKKVEEVKVEEPKSPCEIFGHNWRDFPPYLEYSWCGRAEKSTITITEAYVCTCCHERENKKLFGREYQGYSEERFFEEVKKFEKEYKDLIKPPAIVEDMIQDAIRVDRMRLKYWDQLHAAEPQPKEKFEFKIKENDVGELVGKPVILEH